MRQYLKHTPSTPPLPSNLNSLIKKELCTNRERDRKKEEERERQREAREKYIKKEKINRERE